MKAASVNYSFLLYCVCALLVEDTQRITVTSSTESNHSAMGITTPVSHRHVGDSIASESGSYSNHFPVLAALLGINATEDQVCELMAIAAVMTDFDGLSPPMETINDVEETETLLEPVNDRQAMESNGVITSDVIIPTSQLESTYELAQEPFQQMRRSYSRQRRRSRLGLRRAHQSFANEMEVQFNQTYQRYFLRTGQDDPAAPIDESHVSQESVYTDYHHQLESHPPVNSPAQRVIRSLQNHLRFLRGIRSRRTALDVHSPYAHPPTLHGQQTESVRDTRRRRRWGMILSRHSFHEELTETGQPGRLMASLTPYSYWAATSTSPSSPFMSNTNNRRESTSSIDANDNDHTLSTGLSQTLVSRGQYRQLQSPETFVSSMRVAAQTQRQQATNASRLEQRSPSFADLASMHSSLVRQLSRQQLGLFRQNDHDDPDYSNFDVQTSFFNNNAQMNEEDQRSNVEFWNSLERMLIADEETGLDYEDLLALSNIIGEVRSRGASEYQLALLKQITVEEHKGNTLEPSGHANLYRYMYHLFGGYMPKEIVNVFPTCNHVFHDICLQQWLKHNQACPLCRCIL
ncbi:hypothetical protein BDF19DRAFT_435874 [Syncephalis fuscata]|nr:hypothetical protein BDF19DRAFT_435874 [Syncephalis fuscata]